MEVYYEVKAPSCYGGIDSLYRLMKQRGENVMRKQVADWLAEQETYGLRKPVRRRFARRKIYSRGIDYLWKANLVDVSHLVEENDEYRYLLTVIDVFSKQAWAKKLKKKNGKSVTDAFDEIFVTRKPAKLQTDKGKEILNATFQRRLADLGIQFYVSQNEDIKSSVVECFNRTFKTKMWNISLIETPLVIWTFWMTCYIRTTEHDIERSDVHRSKSLQKTNRQSEKKCMAKK